MFYLTGGAETKAGTKMKMKKKSEFSEGVSYTGPAKN